MRLTAINLATLLVIATSGAAAQERAEPVLTPSQPSATGAAAMPEAPIGHRQPRVRDLPPDVARRERGDEQAKSSEPPNSAQQSGIDPRLRICRVC